MHCWGELGADEKARLQRAILEALRRGIAGSVGEMPEIVVADFDLPENASEFFSSSRYHAERDTYAVPSYQEVGAPKEIPVQQTTSEEETAQAMQEGSLGLAQPQGELKVIRGKRKSIRVHTASQAAALDANADTTGRDAYFGSSKYAPETADRQHLLAHELAHTIQQENRPVQSDARQSHKRMVTGQPNDPLEREAEHTAEQVTRGVASQPLQVTSDRGGTLRRRLSEANTHRVHQIREALKESNWDNADPPGAYFIFNGLSKEDMGEVYNALSLAERKSLEDNLDKTGFDRARMYQVIQQAKAGGTWWREKSGARVARQPKARAFTVEEQIRDEIARKVAEGDQEAQERRRQRLRVLFESIPAGRAKALYERLSRGIKGDALAQFFFRQLTEETRGEMLGILTDKFAAKPESPVPAQAPPASQSPNIIQRDDATGTGRKDSFKPKIKKWSVGKQLGNLPVKLKEVVVGAEITYSTTDNKSDDTQARAGDVAGYDASKGRPSIGLQGAIEKTWYSKIEPGLGDIQFKSKGAAEVTTDGAKIGGDLVTASLGSASVSLKIDVLKYDKEKSEFSFGAATVQAAYEVYKYETTLSDGTSCKVTVKPTLDFVFEPDYAAIPEWMAKQYSKSAFAAIGTVGTGMIAAGFATLAAAHVTMGLGKEISGRVEEAYAQGKEFSRVYQNVLRGEAVVINGRGGALAMEAGDAVIRKVVTQDKLAPIESFYEAARQRSLSEEAWRVGWPIIKQKTLESYKEEHWFEWMVYGEDGPGYRDMRRLLDGFDRSGSSSL